jgi:hypothetical protein
VARQPVRRGVPKTGGGPARTLLNVGGQHVAGVIQMGHPARRRYAFSPRAMFPLPRRVVFYVCVLARTYLVRSVGLLSARDLSAQQPKHDRHGGDHGHERHDHHHR